jgi:uncharacterized protein (DUF488 family)
VEIATIGFTQSSAEHFFGRLKAAGVTRLLDVRLHNVSQLAGFAKANDLAFFLKEIVGARYEHELRLAPTPTLLDAYRKERRPWEWYEEGFRSLMTERAVPRCLDRMAFDSGKTALLCSEAEPSHCHRRIVAELLKDAWGAKVEHL